MRKILWITFVVTILFTSLSAQLPDPQNVVSAKIEANQIKVTYIIPKGYYQTLLKDMLFVEVEEVSGITFEPTVYPEGEKAKDGLIKYHGTITLEKQFKVSENFKGNPLIQIYAGYQLCDEGGICFMPEEVEFNLPQKEDEKVQKQKKKKIQTKKLKVQKILMSFLNYWKILRLQESKQDIKIAKILFHF